MAKVTNQIYDGTEDGYIDEGGEEYFFGESYRQAATDGYPLPSTGSAEVVRKSPRGYKKALQGNGSADQLPWRQCFSDCARQWDELPEECAPIPSCPTRTSKKNVWNAKQAQGVMCSYYDLFMGCCISSCLQITIEGPGGVAYKGGSIPTDSACWPCHPPCKDSELSIAYTTANMITGETQQLIAHDSDYGDEVPCCPTGDLSWEILSGGGYLEPDSGQAVNYTAPDANDDCEYSPVIQVTDCCGRSAALTIGVSAPGLDPGTEAIKTYTDKHCLMYAGPTCADCSTPQCYSGPPPTPPPEMCETDDAFFVCEITTTFYNCYGDITFGPCVSGAVGYDYDHADCHFSCSNLITGGFCYVNGLAPDALEASSPADVRTEPLKHMGCCPSQMM